MGYFQSVIFSMIYLWGLQLPLRILKLHAGQCCTQLALEIFLSLAAPPHNVHDHSAPVSGFGSIWGVEEK